MPTCVDHIRIMEQSVNEVELMKCEVLPPAEMGEPFLGFELLLFRRFQQQPALWYEWRERIRRRAYPEETEDLRTTCLNKDSTLHTLGSLEELGVVDIHQDLWFLSVMVHRRPKHLMEFVKQEIDRERCKMFPKYGGGQNPHTEKSAVDWKTNTGYDYGKDLSRTDQNLVSSETLTMRYLNLHKFTVLNLDSMFKFGDDNRLPREIFQCINVKHLSLKYNSLEYIPCDIGRMTNLEYLALTNNKLSVCSLPFSLIFLKRLCILYLDNNLLDALPGFLLSLPALKTVHRHGNHNFFKSTFIWYHTDVNLRIIPVSCETKPYLKYESLQFWAAKAIIGSKKDFLQDTSIVPVLKDFIADVYHLFSVCHHCNNASLSNMSGFKVITFKNPYLGNTCVPFQHWACSLDCAKSIEIPARLEQVSAAEELDMQYESYVQDCVKKFSSCPSKHNLLPWTAKSPKYSGRQQGDHVGLLGKHNREDFDEGNFHGTHRNERANKRRTTEETVKSKCGCSLC